MIWLSWRQHRGLLGATLLILASVAILLTPSGLAMRDSLATDGMTACLTGGRGADCTTRVHQFSLRFENTQNLVAFLNLFPTLVGAFYGAPLLAREFDHGTWRLAWTQSVPRSRWLATKVAFLGAAVVIAAAVFTAILTWWRAPVDKISSRFEPTAFNFEGLSPVSVWLFSFAVGVLAGAAVRRTVPAMALAVVVFLSVRLPVEMLLRPNYRAALTRGYGDGETPTNIGGKDWIVGATGYGQSYHPGSRFWEFQLIEAGIYFALTAVLVAMAVWLTNRKLG